MISQATTSQNVPTTFQTVTITLNNNISPKEFIEQKSPEINKIAKEILSGAKKKQEEFVAQVVASFKKNPKFLDFINENKKNYKKTLNLAIGVIFTGIFIYLSLLFSGHNIALGLAEFSAVLIGSSIAIITHVGKNIYNNDKQQKLTDQIKERLISELQTAVKTMDQTSTQDDISKKLQETFQESVRKIFLDLEYLHQHRLMQVEEIETSINSLNVLDYAQKKDILKKKLDDLVEETDTSGLLNKSLNPNIIKNVFYTIKNHKIIRDVFLSVSCFVSAILILTLKNKNPTDEETENTSALTVTQILSGGAALYVISKLWSDDGDVLASLVHKNPEKKNKESALPKKPLPISFKIHENLPQDTIAKTQCQNNINTILRSPTLQPIFTTPIQNIHPRPERCNIL